MRRRRKSRRPGLFARWRMRRRPRPRAAVRGRGRRIPRGYIALGLFILLVAGFIYNYYRFDRIILPLVLEAAEPSLQADMNNIINHVIQDIIHELNITAGDFYHQRTADAGSPVLSVNTLLVNEISNLAAARISDQLNNLEPKVVDVPLGLAFGLDTLAQVGPRFSFNLAPIGNALVDFDSRFTAVGINQTHFEDLK